MTYALRSLDSRFMHCFAQGVNYARGSARRGFWLGVGVIGGRDPGVMVAVELLRRLSGYRDRTTLKGERSQSIIRPDQVIVLVERIGVICSSLRFKHDGFDHDLPVERV